MKIDKKEILGNYQKSQTLVVRMIKMIGRGDSDAKIMRGNLSAIKSLNLIHSDLMENYVTLCFNNGMMTKDKKKKEKMIKEILTAMRLYNK